MSYSSAVPSFTTTRWTIVRDAASWAPNAPTTSLAAQAMARLCQGYWYPIYAFIRRSGHSAVEAEDLTQEFFTTLMEKGYLADVDPRKGQFRYFLLAAIKHFLANHWDLAQAQKRGGGRTILSLNRDEAETRYALEPAHQGTPQKSFERQWALSLLQHVFDRLKSEFTAAGKERLFDELKATLTGTDDHTSYRDIATRLNTTEGTIKVQVYRLRRRYRQLLYEEISQTVSDPVQVQEEIQNLISAVSV